MDNGNADIHLIDVDMTPYKFPDFWLAKHKENASMQPRKEEVIEKKALAMLEHLMDRAICKNCGAEII